MNETPQHYTQRIWATCKARSLWLPAPRALISSTLDTHQVFFPPLKLQRLCSKLQVRLFRRYSNFLATG